MIHPMQTTTRSVGPLSASRGSLEPPWQALREANILLREWGGRELQQFNLTFSDFAVLEVCARGPAKASDVGRTIGVTAAGATDVIDRLESRGLVRRVPDERDRRVVLIRVTPTGERLRAQASSVKEGIVRYLSATMTVSERRALTDGLQALVRALRNAPGRV